MSAGENVVKAWECCKPFSRRCYECPYEKDCYHDSFSRYAIADAVTMLKERGPVKRKITWDGVRCGQCDRLLRYDSLFCDRCGRKVER